MALSFYKYMFPGNLLGWDSGALSPSILLLHTERLCKACNSWGNCNVFSPPKRINVLQMVSSGCVWTRCMGTILKVSGDDQSDGGCSIGWGNLLRNVDIKTFLLVQRWTSKLACYRHVTQCLIFGCLYSYRPLIDSLIFMQRVFLVLARLHINN